MDENVTERLLKNYYNARKSWEGWCYLNNIGLKSPNSNIRKITQDNQLLSHCRYLLLKDLHIELYKIIRDKTNTRDNIFKLLKEHNSENASKVLTELNNFKNVLNSITDTRDKFYAHLDEDYKDFLKTSFDVDNYHQTFVLIESAIFELGIQKELYGLLETIPSRDEFSLNITNDENQT